MVKVGAWSLRWLRVRRLLPSLQGYWEPQQH